MIIQQSFCLKKKSWNVLKQIYLIEIPATVSLRKYIIYVSNLCNNSNNLYLLVFILLQSKWKGNYDSLRKICFKSLEIFFLSYILITVVTSNASFKQISRENLRPHDTLSYASQMHITQWHNLHRRINMQLKSF